MPHFLSCVQVILVKISQNFNTFPMKEYIFQNIFFMFVDSILPPYTPENISVLPLPPPYAQHSAQCLIVCISTSCTLSFKVPTV